MWFEFFRFDLKYQLRQPLMWVAGVLMGILAFYMMYSDSMSSGVITGNIHRNAPLTIALNTALFSLLSMFVVTVFIGGAVLRDFDFRMAELLFATHMRKHDYLLGRLGAGMVACLTIFVLISLGMMLGAVLPGNDVSRTGEFALRPYLWSFGMFVLPNLFFMATMQVLLATTTRSMLFVFIGVLLFFVCWKFGGDLARNVNNEWLSVLLDPFGIRAFERMTRYYSIAEANTLLPTLSGFLFWNRLLWISIAALMLVLAVRLFKLQQTGTARAFWFRRRRKISIQQTSDEFLPMRTHLQFSWYTSLRQCWQVCRFDLQSTFKSLPFSVMLLIALILFFLYSGLVNEAYGTRAYPVTYQMLGVMDAGIGPMLNLTVIFFAGELIFKERQYNLSEVTDAMPMPNWVTMVGKSFTMLGIVICFAGVVAVASIVKQLMRGGVPIELGLYVAGLALSCLPYVMLGLLALAVQAIANNKYLGHLIMMLIWASRWVFLQVHLEHNLYIFAGTPFTPYSDLNGYGHAVSAALWFDLYWGLFTIVMLLLAQSVSVRGVTRDWRNRLRLAKTRLSGSRFKAFRFAVIALLSVAAWIAYNTVFVNRYISSDDWIARQVRYELKYRQYYGLPQPRIAEVRAQVDIFPSQRAANIVGHYRLANRSGAPIDTLYIQTSPDHVTQLSGLPPYHVLESDEISGFRILKLERPMAPGASVEMGFSVNVRNTGFSNDEGFLGQDALVRQGAINVLDNGSFIDSDTYFPHFGYNPQLELNDITERRLRGLGDPLRMASPGSMRARSRNALEPDADWVDFDAIVSTDEGQTAIAPGKLAATWDKGGRRFFHYVLDGPVLPYFTFSSARWTVKEDVWHDIPLEIYYDAKHRYNIDHMMDAMRNSLDYYTSSFGQYPFRQLRVVEIPRFIPIAMSAPGTIAAPEDVEFIADLRDADEIDDVAYVTAHDVAQQWWGHQVVGADTQGNQMLTESLAQYSALMVMEKTFGREHLRRFLRHELDRYLRSRSGERVEEVPLTKVESQDYVYYNKGALAFYRLRDEIGDAAVNRALRHFLMDRRYAMPPYPTSRDLCAYLQAETPPDKQQIITDLFEKIVFYDNRVVDASATQRPDGLWDVTMMLHLHKYETDGVGKEYRRAYDEPVEIGVFGEDENGEHDKPLLLERRQFSSENPVVHVTVKEQPVQVGVDPYNILIDREPNDNRKTVSIQ